MNMKRVLDAFRGGSIPLNFLFASVFLALGGIMGLIVIPGEVTPVTEMRVEPGNATAKSGETFTIELVVESAIPVNVFGGEVRFSNDVLAVESIDYNTSIADLWAEKPWYENGAGTLNFGGGTTRPGGFIGEGALMKITFRTLREGTGILSLNDARILLHDGLGTESNVKAPIDALFTIESDTPTPPNLLTQNPIGTSYTILKEIPSPDINKDDKVTIADVSIFMLHMRGGNMLYDFNQDGAVGIKDLSILMREVTKK